MVLLLCTKHRVKPQVYMHVLGERVRHKKVKDRKPFSQGAPTRMYRKVANHMSDLMPIE